MMNHNKILLFAAFLIILAAVVYSMSGGETPEQYIERIEKERERQFKFLKYNADSPLTDEQKRALDSLDYYPVDPGYKVRARLLPVDQKVMIQIPMTDGTLEYYIKQAIAEFELQGSTHRLLLLQSADEPDPRNYFLAFADETSGRETYGGGRFLDVRRDGQNSITIDFNLVYNPYCTYNPDYACPIPPRENILDIPVEAGEKDYKVPEAEEMDKLEAGKF
ncbi:MAG TPA: DUF1684 domain-containing protein [Cyclobacteriaceae bacterium]|nr:DUF1684 domain-containing protein [Cyclobacteriaceae bacterium]